MIRISAAVLILMALAACGRTIVLRNPETGEMAQCTAAHGTGGIPEAERCADAYQSAGWVRLTD